VSKKTLCSSLLLVLALLSSVQAAHIIWVTETRDTDVDGAQDDQAFIDLLAAQGHTVDAQLSFWMTLDGAKVAALNGADLIIVSRASNSGNYDEAGEPQEWNAIETPLILMNVYISRNNRWLWVDSTSIQNLVAPPMEVVVPGHALFMGVALDGNNEVAASDGSVGSGQTSFIGTTDLGNGTLLAATGSNAWVAEWEPGIEFYAGSGQTPAERRLLLCGGTQESGATPQGGYNFTDQGEKIFLNAVKYMLGAQYELASAPIPGSSSEDVPRDVVLSWTPGIYAQTHDVYLGTVFADVNDADRTDPLDVLISQGQDANALDAGRLELGQTYYWRVDEVNSVPDNTVFKGEVWSLTTEPFAYPVTDIIATASGSQDADMGPEKTIDGSGLNALDQHSTVASDMWLSSAGAQAWIQYEFTQVLKLHEMWVWNSNQVIEAFVGLGAKDVTIETSIDGVEWTLLEDTTEFAQAPGTAGYTANTVVDFAGAMARFVRITINAGFGMMPQHGLSEVRFFSIPAQAREPQPTSGDTVDGVDIVLRWRAGREAVSHEISFSTDSAAVANGSAVVATTSESSFDLADQDLGFGTTYFWRVDEVNEAGVPPRHAGELWSFATAEYFMVDDFESYDDDCQRIFFTWLDGLGHNGGEHLDDCEVPASNGNGSGSIVGHDVAPFGETTITYPAGGQSMPLDYDDSVEPYFSEATSVAYALPSDWILGNPEILSLYYRGNPAGFVEGPEGDITMSAAGNDIFNTADEFRFAYKELSGDGVIVARVESILDVPGNSGWSKAGVMMRQTLDASSAFVMACVSSANGIRFYSRPTTGASTNTDSSVAPAAQQAAAAPAWVKLERVGNEFNGYYALDEAGTDWIAMTWNPLTVALTAQVHVGLAVTSHSPGIPTVAEFSGVSTGGANGPWQIEEIGADHPSNDADQLYLALEDNASRVKVVRHPDPTAVQSPVWREWQISLSEFSALNLANVKSVTVGVGERDNPQAGGMGTLYIDNVRVGTPANADPVEQTGIVTLIEE